jgi:hypothetical protein
VPELGIAICEELAEGRSLLSICSDEGMPGRTTVRLGKHAEFRELFDRARHWHPRRSWMKRST